MKIKHSFMNWGDERRTGLQITYHRGDAIILWWAFFRIGGMHVYYFEKSPTWAFLGELAKK